MGENNRIRRRDVLKTTGGVVGGLALTSGVATPATAQPLYFRYDRMRVRVVDIDRTPPRFRTVESPLYLTQARLNECDTDHPCSLDVLEYQRTDDEDDDADDDDADDDDRGCPEFASVVLLCHGESASDAVVLTGLIRDVLTEDTNEGADYVVSIAPTNATNIDNPRPAGNPCPGDDRDNDDDDASQDDDDDDDGDDDNGDDDNDDDDDDDDNGGDG